MWDKDRKIQFWEESYEQTNDNQTAVERKANGKQKPFYFEGSRKRLRSKILWEKEAQRSEKCGDACGAARDAKFVPTRSIAHYTSFRSFVGSARLFIKEIIRRHKL